MSKIRANRAQNKGAAPARALMLLASLSAAAFFFSVSAAPVPPDVSDARSTMERVYNQNTSRDMILRANLDVFEKEGQPLHKQFDLLRIGSLGESKTLVYFTQPKEVRGVELLSINQQGATDRQWIYIPAQERVRSVVPRERSERFVGSDFTYEDIAEDPLDDFTYTVVSADEIMDGHHAVKIQATPVSPDRSQYKFIYYWVLQDTPCIAYAEMYDQDGRVERTMHATGLKKDDGIFGFRHVEVATPGDGTHTILSIDDAHFNSGLTADIFTPDALGRPLPAIHGLENATNQNH